MLTAAYKKIGWGHETDADRPVIIDSPHVVSVLTGCHHVHTLQTLQLQRTDNISPENRQPSV